MDISDYEGADIIFDLNSKDLPESLIGKFDYVIDGGTTEHVFDFPQALKNIASMIKIGGKVFHYLPAHNYINHGFYSVSPSVLQAFYQSNGFRVNHLNIILTSREFWKDPNKFVVDKLDMSFMTNPDYRFCNLLSANFTIMPDCIGILRCITQKMEGVENIENPIQTHWYKAQTKREAILREMFASDLDWSKHGLSIGIFGTGNVARKFINIVSGMKGYSRDKIKGFFDNDAKRQGHKFEGYEIYSPLDIKKIGINVLIIAATISDAEIYAQVSHLRNDGINIIRMREYQYML